MLLLFKFSKCRMVAAMTIENQDDSYHWTPEKSVESKHARQLEAEELIGSTLNRLWDGVEIEEPLFEEAINTGIDIALSEIWDNEVEGRALAYHNVIHTALVMRRTLTAALTIHRQDPEAMTSRQVALSVYAAAWHDVENDYEELTEDIGENSHPLLVSKIALRRGDNEDTSADRARDLLYELNQNEETFTTSEADEVRDAIVRTMPVFTSDKAVYQDLEEAGPVAVSLSIGDIDGAGLDIKTFLREGDRFYREQYPNMFERYKFKGEHAAALIRRHALAWDEGQVSFARGRQLYSQQQIEKSILPEAVKVSLLKLLNFYGLSIEVAKHRHEERLQMNTEELLKSFGYHDPANQ